jgi:glutamate--cysteine ligase
VRVGFGGAVQRTVRWRAAELVAPVATGLFACSPLGWDGDFGNLGGHHGFKSQRARARQSSDATRMGFARPMSDGTGGDPVEEWVELGLEARMAGVHEGRSWIRPRHPFSFADWMEHGVEGRYPDLDDWRGHVASLDTEVFPDAAIELRCADALPGPFQSVPLTFFTALLCDAGAAHAVIDRLDHGQHGGDGPGSLRATWAKAGRAGLADHDLAEQARWLFGLAAEALLRLPESWFSREQLGAFVAYGRRYAHRGLTPADEVLDLFLERGSLGRRELELLEGRWRAVTGRAQGAAA